MIKLPVDITELAEAMEWDSELESAYLDLETGKILQVPIELLEDADADDSEENEDEAKEDEDEEEAPLEIPEWERPLKPVANEIRACSERYVRVPNVTSSDGFTDMVDFARTVTDRHLCDLLNVALAGRGAFRRFKDVLERSAQERARWFAFREARAIARAREWLEEIGVAPLVS